MSDVMSNRFMSRVAKKVTRSINDLHIRTSKSKRLLTHALARRIQSPLQQSCKLSLGSYLSAWEQSLLELPSEVKIQYGCFPTKQNMLDTDWWNVLGRPIRNEINFDLRNKLQHISFPGIFLWQRETSEGIYPRVPDR